MKTPLLAHQTYLHSPPYKMGKRQMPRWQWQLRWPKFLPIHKRYLSFIWRFRPYGCNWSRARRARYFGKSIRTISRWDAKLIEMHLVRTEAAHTLAHIIAVRPYYTRDAWKLKYWQNLGYCLPANPSKQWQKPIPTPKPAPQLA